jgi:hypothetical protein
MSVQVRQRCVGRELIRVSDDGSVATPGTIPEETGTGRVFVNPVVGGTGAQIVAMLYDPSEDAPSGTDGIVITDAGGYLELPAYKDVKNLRIVSLDAAAHDVLLMYHGTN